MMGVSYDGTDEGRVGMMAEIPMVAFRPKNEHTGGAVFLKRSATWSCKRIRQGAGTSRSSHRAPFEQFSLLLDSASNGWPLAEQASRTG